MRFVFTLSIAMTTGMLWGGGRQAVELLERSRNSSTKSSERERWDHMHIPERKGLRDDAVAHTKAPRFVRVTVLSQHLCTDPFIFPVHNGTMLSCSIHIDRVPFEKLGRTTSSLLKRG